MCRLPSHFVISSKLVVDLIIDEKIRLKRILLLPTTNKRHIASSLLEVVLAIYCCVVTNTDCRNKSNIVVDWTMEFIQILVKVDLTGTATNNPVPV